jgi:DNA invertase Pin-like site-specific DNA recombinase
MLDQIRVGDTIVVQKLDRLARSTLFIAGAVLVARIR